MINYNKSIKINTKTFLHDKALKLCSTSLSGGDLVDDLPPAASTKYSFLSSGVTMKLLENLRKFF